MSIHGTTVYIVKDLNSLEISACSLESVCWGYGGEATVLYKIKILAKDTS